jgi:hypothetical protein
MSQVSSKDTSIRFDKPQTPLSTMLTAPLLAERLSDADSQLKLWQAIKKWRRIVFYCTGLASGILMYGYDYVIIGTTSAMPSFQ